MCRSYPRTTIPGKYHSRELHQRDLSDATSRSFPIRTGREAASVASTATRAYTPFINPHIQHDWGFTVDHNLTSAQSLHFSMWRNSFSNWSFDNNPLVIAPNPLNSQKYEPALGTVFLAELQLRAFSSPGDDGRRGMDR